MVEETAGLVVGNEQEGLVPLRAGTEGVVDLLDKDLTGGDFARGVHGVGALAAAGWVDVGKLGKLAEVGVLEEALKRNDILLGVLGDPLEEHGIAEESTVGAIVVAPGDVVLAGGLEDAVDGDGRDIKAVVIVAVAVGGSSNRAETVGVGGLFDTLVCVVS